MKLSQALEGYWLDKQLELSATTIRNYQFAFRQFQAFVGDVEVEDISANDVRRYLQWLLDDLDLTRSTALTRWAILSSFWTWAERELGVKHVIRGHIRRPEFRQRVIEPLTQAELAKLVKATAYTRPWKTPDGHEVRSERPMALRDRAIVMTLADTGLRASELTALRVDDYDAGRGRLHVRHGKRDKERIVVAGTRTRKVLWRYLAERGSTRAQEPLFATREGRHMRRESLYHLIVRLGDRAGVQGVTVHRFRHTFAIEFLRNGGNLLVLQELLGHEDLKTVQIYASIAERDLDESSKHSPADRWRL